MVSLIGIVVSLCLTVIAAFYKSPGAAYYEMTREMAEQPQWRLRAKGIIGENPIKMDLAVSAEGKTFARISYLPLKLINNQWIEIDNSPQPPLNLRGGAKDIFQIFRLTNRLFPLKHNGAWYDRYKFNAPTEIINLFPGIVSAEGELSFPFWPGTMLPLQGVIIISDQSGQPIHFEFSMSYENGLDKNKIQARPLSDVLAQFAEIKNTGMNAPEKMDSLAQDKPEIKAFYSDFDKDGLSDGLEIFYGLDPSNPDTDNDTVLDGFDY